jgi:hypothetical protein
MVVGNVGSAYYRGFYELQIDGNFYQWFELKWHLSAI